GLFGGYPSACNRRRFIKGAGADALIKAGTIPYDTTDLPGERPSFPAKVLRPIDITKDDIYESSPSAGAGWGDPIERPSEALRQDVILGAVSIPMAREIYGVVITADHEVDHKATEARRAEIRKERLSWPAMKTATGAPANDAKGEVLALAGDAASLQRI